MAVAQTLAWALAEKADFGMPPMMAASPSTWMPGCRVDSNANGSTGHQPVRSATPAWAAMAPAFCGGMTLATAALYLAKSVASVSVAGSTEVTRPLWLSDRRSITPG